MPKTLVSISFIVDGIAEESLGVFVAALDENIGESIAKQLDALGDGAVALMEERIEWYGAAVTVQRSLRVEVD